MKVANVSWNNENDDTKITFSDDFETSDWLVKADILQDMIGTLQQHYNAMMSISYWEDRNKFRLNDHKID